MGRKEAQKTQNIMASTSAPFYGLQRGAKSAKILMAFALPHFKTGKGGENARRI